MNQYYPQWQPPIPEQAPQYPFYNPFYLSPQNQLMTPEQYNQFYQSQMLSQTLNQSSQPMTLNGDLFQTMTPSQVFQQPFIQEWPGQQQFANAQNGQPIKPLSQKKTKQSRRQSHSKSRDGKENERVVLSSDRMHNKDAQQNKAQSSKKGTKNKLFERLYSEHVSLKKKKELAEEEYYQKQKEMSKRKKRKDSKSISKNIPSKSPLNEDVLQERNMNTLSTDKIYVQGLQSKGSHRPTDSIKEDYSIFDHYMEKVLSSPKFRSIEEIKPVQAPVPETFRSTVFTQLSNKKLRRAEKENSADRTNDKTGNSILQSLNNQPHSKPHQYQYQSLFDKVQNASHKGNELKCLQEQKHIQKEKEKKYVQFKAIKAKSCFNQLIQGAKDQPTINVASSFGSRLQNAPASKKPSTVRLQNPSQKKLSKPQHKVFQRPVSQKAKPLFCDQIDIDDSTAKSKDSFESKETIYHTNYNPSNGSKGSKKQIEGGSQEEMFRQLNENIINRITPADFMIQQCKSNPQFQETCMTIEENRASLAKSQLQPYECEHTPQQFKNDLESSNNGTSQHSQFQSIYCANKSQDSTKKVPEQRLSQQNLQLLNEKILQESKTSQQQFRLQCFEEQKQQEHILENELEQLTTQLEIQKQASKQGSTSKKKQKNGYIPFSVRMANAKANGQNAAPQCNSQLQLQ